MGRGAPRGRVAARRADRDQQSGDVVRPAPSGAARVGLGRPDPRRVAGVRATSLDRPRSAGPAQTPGCRRSTARYPTTRHQTGGAGSVWPRAPGPPRVGSLGGRRRDAAAIPGRRAGVISYSHRPPGQFRRSRRRRAAWATRRSARWLAIEQASTAPRGASAHHRELPAWTRGVTAPVHGDCFRSSRTAVHRRRRDGVLTRASDCVAGPEVPERRASTLRSSTRASVWTPATALRALVAVRDGDQPVTADGTGLVIVWDRPRTRSTPAVSWPPGGTP